MKKLLVIIALLMGLFTTNAQIGKTIDQIIATNGNNYKKGVQDGLAYISYMDGNKIDGGVSFKEVRTYYFLKYEGKPLICHKWTSLMSSENAEKNISMLNNNFDYLGRMKWKDYDRNIIYKVEYPEQLLILITVYYDSKNN